MAGMMRSRSTGCTCCGDWGPDRAAEKRDWQRREWAQADRRRTWQGDARRPDYWPDVFGMLAEDYLTHGYWAVESADDYWMYPTGTES
ncbi:putative bacteriophage protein [Nocardia nova SH22a]|uniref:Putative bacteriophage protein n=1 Tax=Nocardia nova SH22a TaxID=1415166 RepID=W5TNK1_9NOCA|nr:hypothetical protein [Nocardia nova]AHH20827.1 putative bacteriophage protein [Nocardia nova SH22a]